MNEIPFLKVFRLACCNQMSFLFNWQMCHNINIQVWIKWGSLLLMNNAWITREFSSLKQKWVSSKNKMSYGNSNLRFCKSSHRLPLLTILVCSRHQGTFKKKVNSRVQPFKNHYLISFIGNTINDSKITGNI